MYPFSDVALCSASSTGFYSVYRRICFPSGTICAQLYFILIAASVFQVMSTVLQAPTVFILFIAVSVFRVACRATAFHSDKAVESSLS